MQRRLRRYLFVFCAFITILTASSVSSTPLYGSASARTTGWAISYGGGSGDLLQSVTPTSDGGYLAAGFTYSFGAGGEDAWVLKLDGAGNPLWQKTYGGNNFDRALSIARTSDGGSIVAGSTESFGAGDWDGWVLKLDETGTVVWQKTYGGSGADGLASVAPAGDGGYIAVGGTPVGATGFGGYDYWVLKLDETGTVVWQKTYGGWSDEHASSVAVTGDGGYVVAGSTFSFGTGQGDAWVLKLDSAGGVIWQKTFAVSESSDISANSIIATSDGGFIVTGSTKSRTTAEADAWVLKLDSAGGVMWQKTFAGSQGLNDHALSSAQLSDGGYIVVGQGAYYDALAFKLDGAGNPVWQKTYDSLRSGYASFVASTSDGGAIIAGVTDSLGTGDDGWVLKLDGSGNAGTACAMSADASGTFASPGSIVGDTAVMPGATTVTAAPTSASAADTNAQVATQCGPLFTYPLDPTRAAWHNDYNGHTPRPNDWNTCYNVAYNVPYHTGQDYGFRAVLVDGKWTNNTLVSAVAEGIVRYSSKQIGTRPNGTPIYGGTTSYPGGVVIIEHTRADGTPLYAQYGTPIHSVYAHLDPDKILVAVGQRVNRGDPIATGLKPQLWFDKKTGAVTLDNTHLHWEMRYFYDGSEIKAAPQYKSPCATEPGPGYSYNTNDALAHPDNFEGIIGKNKDGSLIYKTYHWTNPVQFVETH